MLTGVVSFGVFRGNDYGTATVLGGAVVSVD
jgi:hypothetical protein